ncbi:O-acetyltransferase OatA [compost metagenome]
MSTHLSHPKYRPDIDGLRAVAVLSVVIFHAFPEWLNGGFIGVDVFFVISGFLISSIIFKSLDSGSFSFIDFYSRRVKRIFPSLILVLVSCYVFGWFSLLADEYAQLGKHIASGAGFISNFTLLSEVGYFDNSAETKPLLHLWSLGIEEQFYIVWPLAAFITWKLRANIVILAVLMAAVFFSLNLYGIDKDPTVTFYSPHTRFWELLSGGMLAWVSLYRADLFKKLQGHGYLSLIGITALIAGFVLLSKEIGFPGKWALIPVVAAVLIIAAGPDAWLNRTVLSSRGMVWFGLISYPLYLWHWPLLTFARIVEGDVPGIEIRVAAVVLAITLSWATVKFIERPIRQSKQGQSVLALCTLMLAVGCVGFATNMKDGLANREFPKSVAAHLGSVADYKTTMQAYGLGKCFIDYEQGVDVLASGKCVDLSTNQRRLIVFGDSEAAHLMGGVRKEYVDSGFVIEQWTGTSCRPFEYLVKGAGKRCIDVSREFMSSIFPSLRSGDVVIVGANWIGSYAALTEPVFSQAIKDFMDELAQGDARVVIVGNTPDFKTHPVKAIARKISFSSERRYLPVQDYTESNAILEKYAKEHGIEYFNPTTALCDPQRPLECLAFDGKDVIYFDPGHLSEAGSELVIKKLSQDIDIDGEITTTAANANSH